MGWLDNFFSGNQEQAYRDAGQYYNQVPGYWNSAVNPMVNAMNGALPGYMKTLGQLTTDPSSFQNNIMQNYYKSPMYNDQLNAATTAANQAGAASGTIGTPSQQEAVAQAAQNIASQNENNYVNQVMGGLSQGLSGTQGVIGMGNQDELARAQALTQNASDQAANTWGQDTAQGTGWMNMLATAGKAATGYATGGASGILPALFGGQRGGQGGSMQQAPQQPNPYMYFPSSWDQAMRYQMTNFFPNNNGLMNNFGGY